MRWVLVVLLAVVMVAGGCSGDDDDTASDAATTTGVPSSTTVVSESEEAVAAATTTTTLPTHEIGDPVEPWEGATLTITSIEADPVPDCESLPPKILSGDEERFVLIRGTLDDPGHVDEDGMLLMSLSERDDPDGYNQTFGAEVPAGAAYPAELEWCFFIPADEPSWTFTFVPPLSGEWSSPGVWDVNI